MDPGSGQTGAMRPSVLPLPLVDPGSGQTGAFSGNSNNDAEKESQNPSGQGAAVDIDQEEIAARIKDTMGDSGMEWIRNMDGCKNPAYGYAFIELAVKPGEEQQASAWIEGKCGKGDDASLKKTPMFTNRICDSMRAKRMLLAYTYFTQGSGGAKTKSVTVYTAETEEGMYVYLLRI